MCSTCRVESHLPVNEAGLQADFARDADVPFLDVVATLDDPAGQAAVLMLNRDLAAARDIVLEWGDVAPTRVLACETLTGPDLKAVNTFADPRRVAPRPLDPPGGGRPYDRQPAAALIHGGASGNPAPMTRRAFPIACAVALLLMTRGPIAAAKQPASAKGPAFVDITWMSITNMLLPAWHVRCADRRLHQPDPAERVFRRRWRSGADAASHVSDVAAVKEC